MATEYVWRPQSGPQKALVDCPVYEIFYGGARGGGKTDGVLGKMALKARRYGDGFNCVFFRKELPMLDDAIARSHQIYAPLGADWNEQKKTWTFPWGGRMRFRPLERVQDAEKYQGQNISDICIEEAGNYADPAPIRRLHAVLRSAAGVPTQMHLTGNPGGAGQGWIRQRFVDPAPQGFKVIKETLPNGQVKSRVYIPAKVHDNKILLANDPSYIGNLYLTGSEALVRAWLDGDWNAIEGAYFDCFKTDRHVIRPFEIPEHWTRFRSFDWGSAKPFSVGWWAISDGSIPEHPKGKLIRYREWYGMKSGEPNVGLKLTAEEVADGIKSRDGKDKITYSVADPSIWKVDGGPSIAERMAKRGVIWRQADNSRLNGWDQVRQRLIGEEDKAMVGFFSKCTETIRTLPMLQHDTAKAEDIDTEGEDHAADEIRYACMSRPYTRTPNKPKRPLYAKPTLGEMMKELDQTQREKAEKRKFR